MLAGMRVAFESMLAQFDPERLQEDFDRQLSKGSLLGMPGKTPLLGPVLRNRQREMLKDPEASFRTLFGEAFARAYDEQMKLLKANRPNKRS